MKFRNSYSLENVAKILDCQYVGDANLPVYGMNEIHRVVKGDIVFVDHPKYYDKALESAATIILINKEVDCPEGKGLLISDDPFRDFNKLGATHFSFIAASSSISASAQIGEGTAIQPNVFVGHNVVIGKNCLIHSNVSIYDNTRIGDDVIIHANTTLGADAFYYKKRESGYDRLKSIGNVVIQDRVELGANCTIDRGVSDSTIIGEGTKIDNGVQIGHDTQIGKNCLLASHVGIAGCTIVEDNVTLWGQVGVGSGITIGKGAIVLAQSGVAKSIEGGKKYFGYPATDARIAHKQLASVRILPEIIERLNSKD